MPPSIARDRAGAWTTWASQARQAYLGRIVRITRSSAGTISRASLVSSPMRSRESPQQDQTVLSGSITSSKRGRCFGRAPMLRDADRCLRGGRSLPSAASSLAAAGTSQRRRDRARSASDRGRPASPILPRRSSAEADRHRRAAPRSRLQEPERFSAARQDPMATNQGGAT